MNKIIILSLCCVLFFACKDDEAEPKNEFTYNNETYELNKGFIEDFDTNSNGSFDVDVFLTSSNVNFDTGVGDFIGFGDMVYLDLNTNSAGQLVTGTYNYSVTRNAFTFVDGNILTSFNFTTLSGPEDEVVAGTVEVEAGSPESTIEFDLVTVSGLSVIGRYMGTFEDADF
ncbi:MAG: hypothetical protein HKN92_09610 [Chitinophagales bacterium]|nr:hypothetical protein [Chitinophagales bacterium]